VRTLLNLEMAATSEMVNIAVELQPDIVTLVPEKREERTTEGGLDPTSTQVAEAVQALSQAGIPVSLFVDPEPKVLEHCTRLNAPVVELHTGDYAEAKRTNIPRQIARLRTASSFAAEAGLKVAAGHGLDYTNVTLVSQIPEIEELNIGHSIIARSVFCGLDRAVRDMLALVK